MKKKNKRRLSPGEKGYEDQINKMNLGENYKASGKGEGWIVVVFLIIVFFGTINFIQEKGSGIIEKIFKSEAKEYCSSSYQVRSAKTDYAAKKAYKACLKKY